MIIDIRRVETWYTAGDLNTKFYHALTKQRRARNMIVGLHDEAGNWITEDKGVEKWQWIILMNYLLLLPHRSLIAL